ncbi:chromosome segregation protein ScpA [Streptomyces albus subsp. albus]|nr:chromosome segregation protein ScpA [Streptomyces albus subsp. albus]
MPTHDDPAAPPRTPRRPLGRGPGTGPSAPETAPAQRPGPATGPAEPGQPPEPDQAPAPGPATPAAGLTAAGTPAPAPISARAAGPAGEPGGGGAADEPRSPAGAPEGQRRPGPRSGGPGEAVASAEHRAPATGSADAAGPAGKPDGAPGTDQAQAPSAVPPAGDGRFTVRLANFEGPFDLLLQLISKHKLDVTEVALSKVTDEFMAHIRAMGPDWDLDQTTEFLVVAATLLDLKAARLLPAAEVEDEADLALLEARDLLFARLLQYRAYKQVADIFSARLDAEAQRYPRTVGLEPQHAELLPEVVISIGAEGFAGLAVKAMQPKAKPQVYVDHIHAPLVSVREQAEVVIARLRAAGEASFQTLVEDAPDTLTVVARFLALLELYREKAVALEQPEALGALMVRWAGDETGRPLVTDEFDRTPESADDEEKR